MTDGAASSSNGPVVRSHPEYDVIILGAGLAGSVLGAVLARNGTRVLIVDAGTHPKFAIGESMIPYTLLALRTISERYDVPEIATLASFDTCIKDINTSFGWKKHFGFLRHEDGKEPNPWESNQFNTPGVLNKSSHLFRQDTDAYLFNTAVRYGCESMLSTMVDDVEFDSDSVSVIIGSGRTIRGRYLVDASGYRSPLARKLELREEPCRFKHHSRSLFSHMVNVRTTDESLLHTGSERPPVPWSHGTMHHLFDRGWFWVIPFNNNPHSKNPLVSVGVTMDPRKYPKPDDISAEQEFFEFASRFPAVERQFREARSVRPWVSTGRLQYSSTGSVGERWCLMSHAAGFLDPLFSRGLSNTAEVINALAGRLLQALKDDDFSVERFGYVERLEQGLLDYNDKLVNCAYISFDHYDLWNAVFRVWSFGSVLGAFRLQKAMTQFRRTGDDSVIKDLEKAPNTGLWWPDHDDYAKLFRLTVEQVESYGRGEIDGRQAANRLFSELEKADYIPPGVGFNDRNTPFLYPTPRKLLRTVGWVVGDAPKQVRELVGGTAKEVVKARVRGRRLF